MRRASRPFGSRGGLSDAKGIGTPLPDSKVTGDPVVSLTASMIVRSVRGSNPTPGFRSKPEGFFERTYDARDPMILGGDVDRRKARLQVEHADRIARFTTGPRGILGGQDKPTGIDWARSGRVMNPHLPGGKRGLIAVTREGAQRGVLAGQTIAPVSTIDALAQEGRKVGTVGNTGRSVPVGEAPVSTAPSGESKELPKPNAQPKDAIHDGSQLLMAGIAVFAVFLIVRG